MTDPDLFMQVAEVLDRYFPATTSGTRLGAASEIMALVEPTDPPEQHPNETGWTGR